LGDKRLVWGNPASLREDEELKAVKDWLAYQRGVESGNTRDAAVCDEEEELWSASAARIAAALRNGKWKQRD
jgi:hypothetical protein